MLGQSVLLRLQASNLQEGSSMHAGDVGVIVASSLQGVRHMCTGYVCI